MTDEYTPSTGEVHLAYIDRKDFEDAIANVDRRGDEAASAEFYRWLALDRVATLTNLLTQMSTVMYENEYEIRAAPQALILEEITRYKKEAGLV